MPIQRAAFKSVRKDKKRHLRNLRITSELKSLEKKVEGFFKSKNPKEASLALRQLISKIDKAASKGTIHRNRASRKIARLMKRLAKLKQ
ncbi:MAG: 30S ribosomal protein S20 [Candidatus Omnitrophica bacterium]|nr:30S ribosomal protein S20 [Candidatus Omnitrophota bacterium]